MEYWRYLIDKRTIRRDYQQWLNHPIVFMIQQFDFDI